MGPLKILWVKANKLLPLHSGGDIRSYHIARYLASQHELCFFSYYGGKPDPGYEREMAEHFPAACCVSTGRQESVPARALDYLLRLPGQAPYAVSRFKSGRVQGKLKAWFEQRRFDVAVCDFLDAAINLPSSRAIPSVLFQHNVESEIWRRHAETEASRFKRPIYALEFRKMLAYEKSVVREFAHVVAVSEHDRKLMSAWVDRSRITMVPTGVDLRQYRTDVDQVDFSNREAAPLVLFVGAMDWEPNIDAVEYFCEEVWPLLLAQFPEAKFRIVGRNPARRVEKLGSSSIEVTGRVPAVVDHLRAAAVVVVPLRIGGGTRLKIYEAMATGRAVVSTSVGAEGLDVHHGKDVILADNPKAFAEAVLMLLKDGDVRRRYERAAADLARGYDWPVVGAKFEEVLEKVTGRAALAQGRQYTAASFAGSGTSSAPGVR